LYSALLNFTRWPISGGSVSEFGVGSDTADSGIGIGGGGIGGGGGGGGGGSSSSSSSSPTTPRDLRAR
jgi:hypothetical protein